MMEILCGNMVIQFNVKVFVLEFWYLYCWNLMVLLEVLDDIFFENCFSMMLLDKLFVYCYFILEEDECFLILLNCIYIISQVIEKIYVYSISVWFMDVMKNLLLD